MYARSSSEEHLQQPAAQAAQEADQAADHAHLVGVVVGYELEVARLTARPCPRPVPRSAPQKPRSGIPDDRQRRAGPEYDEKRSQRHRPRPELVAEPAA